MDPLWIWIANISGVLGIITTFFSGYAALRLYQQNRTLRARAALEAPRVQDFTALRALNEGVQSYHPVALAVSLTPQTHSIRTAVEQHLNAAALKMEVEEIFLDGIQIPEGLEAFIHAVSTKRRYFEEIGVTEVHLFYSGPVATAVLLGSMLDNWVAVKLYQYEQGKYVYWLPLIKAGLWG